jgi:UDP-galactopyranose mutase
MEATLRLTLMTVSLKILVVGAGFSGAVVARELAECGQQVTVIEASDHVAGHAHTQRDDNGVMEHVYGPHIFNTNDREVWGWVQRFGAFRPFTNRVKAVNARGVFSFPINLHTLCQFFGQQFTPETAQAFVQSRAVKFDHEPQDFEEQALSMVGAELYEAFFRDYTRKQWGRHPATIPASVLKRLPMRFNFDDNYYNVKYQGIPVGGYTTLVGDMLLHENISLRLRYEFEKYMIPHYAHVFHTGPIDAFFDYDAGRLSYRTLDFRRITGRGDMQGNAVINYTDNIRPCTRISEHKHFAPWETHEGSALIEEYPRDAGPADTPFYPIRGSEDLTLLEGYERAVAEHFPTVTFLGRLGRYRYFDMDDVIRDGLNTARQWLTDNSHLTGYSFNCQSIRPVEE